MLSLAFQNLKNQTFPWRGRSWTHHHPQRFLAPSLLACRSKKFFLDTSRPGRYNMNYTSLFENSI